MNGKPRNRKVLAAVAASVAGALVLSACGDDGGSTANDGSGGGGEVVVGVIQPLTGAAALSAKEIVNGVKLAVDKANASAGPDDFTIKLEEYDTKLDPATAVTVFTQAVSQGKAVGIIGPYATSEVQAVSPTSLRLEAPFISPTVSTTSVTQGEGAKYAFRSGVVNEDVTATNIQMARKQGCAKPALLHDEGGYGIDYQKGISANIAPLSLVATESFGVAATDVTAQVQTAKAAGADCVFLGASGGASVGLVLKTMAAVGLQAQVFGPDSLITADTRRVAGPAVDQLPGVYAVQALDTKKAAYTTLLEEYEEKFGDTPVSPFWVSSYDAANLLIAGIKESGGKGGADLLSALESLQQDAYTQVYGAEGAGGGYGPDDHNWLSGSYLIPYKVTETEAVPAPELVS